MSPTPVKKQVLLNELFYFKEMNALPEVKMLIIIPAYNEEENLPGVIEDLKDHLDEIDMNHIVIIDDGSIDQTTEVAKSLGATVITFPYNLGIGGAVQTGFLYAAQNDYEIVLRCDGDGQHRADQISRLIEPVLTGRVDVVIGSRFLVEKSYDTPFLRNIGIKLFSVINSVIIGQKITDSTSGFRAYNRKAIKFLAKHYPQDYPEPEALVILKKNGFRLAEVPVEMRQRMRGKSSITFFSALYYMIKVCFAVFMGMFKY